MDMAHSHFAVILGIYLSRRKRTKGEDNDRDQQYVLQTSSDEKG
jgi:hypothetical protein